MRHAHTVSSLAIELVLPIVGGLWLDQKWQTQPWLLLAGVLVGSLLAGLGLQSFLKSLDRESSTPRPKG